MRGEKPGIDHADSVWDCYRGVLPGIPSIPGGRTIGVCYHGSAADGETTYFVGAEVDSGERELPGLVLWRLPVREYVVCGFEAEDSRELTGTALSKAMQYTRIWLRKHGLIADGFFPEMYYPNTPNLAYMELWVPYRYR
jgi:AraC family transcriptional regulator